ncbi:MAG: TadE/TadG family type IV pilus assembly protein [Pseudomonadota bacterium]|nr:TadE/TadG family type IV pilus assembly protein [Pseudomonadota bacterium]
MRALQMMTGLSNLLSRALHDQKGVSAIEFAMVLPVMVALYVGSVELSHTLTIDRRVTAVASATADLIAQSEQVSTGDLNDIFEAASSIMTPYSATPIKIKATSVVADQNNNTKVEWSAALHDTPYAPNTSFPLPEGLTQPFTSVIVAEVSYTYTPPIGENMTGGITLTDKFYLRPRRSLTVAKTN